MIFTISKSIIQYFRFEGTSEYTSRETTMSKWLYFPTEKGSTLKGKNLLHMGAYSFLLG